MNTADIVVAIIIVLCGIISLRLGLVRVVLGLAGWIGAGLSTIYGYSYIQPYAREFIGNGLIADITAGVSIFVVTMIILTVISHAIAGSVRDSAFGMLDRTFGVLVGLAIGGVIVSGGYIFSQQVFAMDDNGSFYKDAKTLPILKSPILLKKLTQKQWLASWQCNYSKSTIKCRQSLLLRKFQVRDFSKNLSYTSLRFISIKSLNKYLSVSFS